MITLEEQLKKFPPGFSLAVEHYKFYDFESSLEYILNANNLVDEFNNISKDTKKDFIDFLKILYAFGFYSGVRFTLDPANFEDNRKPNQEEQQKEA